MIMYISTFVPLMKGAVAAEKFGIKNVYRLVKKKIIMSDITQSNHSGPYNTIV